MQSEGKSWIRAVKGKLEEKYTEYKNEKEMRKLKDEFEDISEEINFIFIFLAKMAGILANCQQPHRRKENTVRVFKSSKIALS